MQRLNAFHSNLKFIYKKFKVSINFLVVTVTINDEEFEAICIVKPLITISFLSLTQGILQYSQQNLIFYSQELRIKKLCYKSQTFEKHLESLRSWFEKQVYRKKHFENQIKRVLETKRNQNRAAL